MASTIKDVARLAGVSISTVSRVANNASNVSPPIRKKGAAGDQGTELYTQHRGTQLGGAQPEKHRGGYGPHHGPGFL